MTEPEISTTTLLGPMRGSIADFAFLQGSFDVASRRLSDPRAPDSGWAPSHATSIARNHFGGAVSIDEMWFPTDAMYGMSLRVFDPAERDWTIYWVNDRSSALQAPVVGTWQQGRCWLTGVDEYAGEPILASYSWSAVEAASAEWEQCFSFDDGASWQPNWTMRFVNRADEPDHSAGPAVTADFDFLQGDWRIHHRRLSDRRDPGSGWVDFDGAYRGYKYFNGAISVDELSLAEPGQRGLTFRVYNPASGEWSIYWIDSSIGQLQKAPTVGRFEGGIGRFFGVETIGGQPVHVRFIWSEISPRTARWQQAFSFDEGRTWIDNWDMHFTREHV